MMWLPAKTEIALLVQDHSLHTADWRLPAEKPN